MIDISDVDAGKVVDAIRKAEKRTSAEIFAVLCERSSDYRFTAHAMIFFWIFLSTLATALLLEWWQPGWNGRAPSLTAFAAGQLAVALTGMAAIHLFPRLPLLVTPAGVIRERVHRHAVSQFMAHGIHNTERRNGVLVFISLSERHAEIVVDSGIETALGREPFLEQVALLSRACSNGQITEGYCAAIEAIADLLAGPFPPGRKRKNEIADRLVILV